MTTITDRQKAALKALGYGTPPHMAIGSPPVFVRMVDPLGTTVCTKEIEEAWAACWDHAKKNCKALMSGMVIQVGRTVVNKDRTVGELSKAISDCIFEDKPHEAVWALWAKVCAGVEP